MEAGHDHRLVDAIRLERVELAVEQRAAVEVDQALGPVVDQWPSREPCPAERMMAFMLRAPLPSKCGGDWALADSADRMRASA